MKYYSINLKFAGSNENYSYAGYDGNELTYGPRRDTWTTQDKSEAESELKMILETESKFDVAGSISEFEVDDE